MIVNTSFRAYYTQQSPNSKPRYRNENPVTMIETIREAQTRTLEQMRTAHEQVIEFNERIADTVTSALPDFQSPFGEYLPKPTELVNTYFDFLSGVQQANAEFASRLVKAWDRSEAAVAAK